MYNKYPKRVIADSGYGSEENYEYLKERDIEGYVKYNYFHKEQKKSFKKEIYRVEIYSMMKKKMSIFVRITDTCNIREHKQITAN